MSVRHSFLFLTLLGLASSDGVAATRVVDLSAQQKQFLANIENTLKQAETNLKGAEDSAGSADRKPTASQTKLALNRAAQARSSLDAVKDALAKLPAEDALVKALAERADKIATGLAALETRLTGGAAPPAAGGGAKLDYKQEQALKDAQFYLREIEGAAGALEGVVATAKAAKSPSDVDHNLLAQAMATIDKAKNRQAAVEERLGTLPANGAGVAEARDALKAAVARIEAANGTLKPIHDAVAKTVDPGSYPELEKDVTRIQGLGQMFADSTVLTGSPAKAAAVVSQRAAAREELARVRALYAALMAQGTNVGERVTGASRFLNDNLDAFDRQVEGLRGSLPTTIHNDIAAALKMTEDAVKEQKPLFFGGGIPQAVAIAESKVPLLAAIDANAAKPLEGELAAMRQQIAEKQRSLRDAIIAENPLPPDRYTAADRQSWVDLATATWKQQQPNAEVLAARIPSDRFERETMWRYQNREWYLVDRSKLQVQLIVKHDDSLAVIRPIDIWIDHAAGDKKIASAFHSDAKAELQPNEYLKRDRVK